MTKWPVPIDYSEGQMIDIVEIQIGAISREADGGLFAVSAWRLRYWGSYSVG